MNASCMTSQETTAVAYVVAEEAPIGVPLWSGRDPELAPNFTLLRVAVIRNAYRSYVEWTFANGSVDTFSVGEKVEVQLP